MDAASANITNIFNRSRTLEIPYFQRFYVWKEEQWERFLDDMRLISKLHTPYFMGSIILKQHETSSSSKIGDVRSIIDGQQRLTTTILFFKALFLKDETPERFSEIFHTFEGELILAQNYYDKDAFEKILLDKELTENDKKKEIYQCYDYFLNNITKNEMNANSLLGNVMFVSIDLNYQEDEQQIFDTINSLGVSLTTAELLKNYFFNKEDIQAYIDNWKDIFEKEDNGAKKYWGLEITAGRNKRSNIDLFLESYLMIKIQEQKLAVSSDDKERFFKISSVFNSYKEFIKKYKLDKNDIIKELKDYAKVYRENINPKIVECDIEKDDYQGRLNIVIFALETATIIPYVLYVCKQVQDSDEKNKIFKYLEAYLMRRIITRSTTKNYNQLFKSLLISNEINSLGKLKEIIEKKSDKLNFMPTDENVKKGFNESSLTNNQARGVLYLIEKAIRSDLNSTELKFIKEYSLEHVMPKKWEKNWNRNNLLTEDQKTKRDRLVLTLGNLTIITKRLNSSISNADWETKKKGKGNHKGLNEYANGIEIFSKYLQRDVWNEEFIKERAEELYKFSVEKVWSLENK